MPRLQNDLDEDFRFKSFMVELTWAHVAPSLDLADYPAALEGFFGYLIRSEFEEVIAFTDFTPKLPPHDGLPIDILDPVNAENNVARFYSSGDRDKIVRAAQLAFDAIVEARFATTKSREVDCWQVVLGPTFREP